MALLREITENLEAISGGAVDVLARVANEFDRKVSRLALEASPRPVAIESRIRLEEPRKADDQVALEDKTDEPA